MPKSYELAPTEVTSLLTQVVSEYHQRLENIDVRIGVLMVKAPIDEETGIRKGTALTGHAGAPAAAQIKLVPLKDRITKKFDVELQIDGDNWPELSDAQKTALLDHELTHIIEGDETDDIGRPKLKMRDEDFIVWGFIEVVQRHGIAAMESRAVRNLIESHGPLLLGNAVTAAVKPLVDKMEKGSTDAEFDEDADDSAGSPDEDEDDVITPPKKKKK